MVFSLDDCSLGISIDEPTECILAILQPGWYIVGINMRFNGPSSKCVGGHRQFSTAYDKSSSLT